VAVHARIIRDAVDITMSSAPTSLAPRRLLGVFAHPDDEVFCAGGTLAKYVASGAEAMVVSVTRGQSGQIRDARAATRRTLGQVREGELRRACDRLGVQHSLCLDYVDGTLRDLAPDTLTGEVLRILRAFRPDVVITFGAAGGYGHPDHMAVSVATTEACALASQTGHVSSCIYHSHFPRNQRLFSDRLAKWLVDLDARFRGTIDFAHALSLFATETATMGYCSDHSAVHWFPAGFYIIEQGEPGDSLYLILSGHVEVVQEAADGSLSTLNRLGPGEFCGELAIAYQRPRNAHVIAVDNVTCLVLSPSKPDTFAGRGPEARLVGADAPGLDPEGSLAAATTCIDVSAYVERKVAALAEHRTQYPIQPDMLPLALLQEMFGHEYFVRVYPPVELEAELRCETVVHRGVSARSGILR
jgi:LmbE family N-acetylglucosaminyl deacetylase